MSDTGHQQREVDYFVDILRSAISARPGDYLFRRDVYERTRSALIEKTSARGMSEAVVARMSASLGLAREIVEADPESSPVIEVSQVPVSGVAPLVEETEVVDESATVVPATIVSDGSTDSASLEATMRIDANDEVLVETTGWAPSPPVDGMDRKASSSEFGSAFVAEFDRIAGEPIEVLRREIESVYPEPDNRGPAKGRGFVSTLLSRIVPSRRQRAPEGAAS